MKRMETETGKRNVSGKQTYQTIDCAKLVLSFFVIGIHTDPLGNSALGLAVALLVFTLAVPLFFGFSGFFLSSKLQENPPASLRKYCARLLKLYGIWTIIYLPEIILEYKSRQGWGMIQNGGIVLLRNLLFCGSYNQLWYLIAAVWGVVFLYLSFKVLKNEKAVIVLCLCMCAIAMLFDSCAGLVPPALRFIRRTYQGCFVSVRNGLLFGFPFLGVGLCAKRLQKKMKPQPAVRLVLIALVLFLFRAAAVYVIKLYDQDLGIHIAPGTWATTLVLLLLLLQIKLPISAELSVWLRKSSTLIFLIHPYCIRIAKLLTASNMIVFVITIVLSCVFSAMILFLEKRKRFRWLKNLY